MQVVYQAHQIGWRRLPDGMLEGALPQCSGCLVQPVVSHRDMPFKFLHYLADGDIADGSNDQVKVIAHEDKSMKLHGQSGADFREHFKHDLLFCLAKQKLSVRGSVPDMIGIVVAHGASLLDADLSSPRVAFVQAILMDQPGRKAVAGFPMGGIKRAAA